MYGGMGVRAIAYESKTATILSPSVQDAVEVMWSLRSGEGDGETTSPRWLSPFVSLTEI
jgi:hypothetical protein